MCLLLTHLVTYQMKHKTSIFSEDCFSLAFQGRSIEVGEAIPNKIKAKFYSYAPEAREIWDAALCAFATIEDKTKTPYRLNEKPKIYALDGIVVADSLGISKTQRFAALQIFSIYYLAVHLLDDLIEDPTKFRSKFSTAAKNDVDLYLDAIGVSFILHATMSASRILSLSGCCAPEVIVKIGQKFTESLAKQIRYFTLEKGKNMTPEKILEIKQHCVSGEATSFIADCLQLDNHYGESRYRHIKKALKHLGSLTQFTDDLRDYHKDIENGNANLLISMEGHYGANAQDTFMTWYLREERLMAEELVKAKFVPNDNLISAIPWHPFFMKHLSAQL